MCVNPKKIIHRSNHWNENDPVYLYVPCGHCHECASQQRNDWFVRCYLEWKHSVSTFFYTLTYNEDFLPHVNGFPCFSRRDIQLFIKKLRKVLDSFGIHLKYFVSSELGESTHRPHYHVLFFLDGEISPFLFRRLVEDSWSKSKRDKFGFCTNISRGYVMQGKLNAGLVTDDRGIAYVTKYVTKDLEFQENVDLLGICDSWVKRLNDLYDFYCNRYGLYNTVTFRRYAYSVRAFDLSTNKVVEDTLPYLPFVRWFNRRYRQCSNFHLQSQFFGVIGVDKLQNDLSLKILDSVVIVRSDGQVHNYSLPRYFKRKFWYDVFEGEKSHKKDRFVLSDEGRKHLIENYQASLQRNVERINSYVDFQFPVTKELVGLINSQFVCPWFFSNEYMIKKFLRHVRTDLDMEVLSIYQTVFRDRVCLVPFSELELNDHYIKSSWLDVVDFHLHDTSLFDFGKLYELNIDHLFSDEKGESILFNNHPYFAPYETALRVIQGISVYVRSIDSKFKINEERRINNVRKILQI